MTALLIIIGIIAALILFVSLIVFINRKRKEKFRKEHKMIEQSYQYVQGVLMTPSIMIDVIFRNINNGKYVYKHKVFDWDRFDSMNYWLQDIGGKPLSFDKYSELTKAKLV